LFFFTYVLTTVLFFVSGRLRLPVLPLLYVYAAFAVTTIIALLRGKGAWRRGLLLLPGAVVAGLVLALQPSLDQRFEQEHLKLGKIEFEAGRYAKAAERFERSLEQRITLDGHINLANANAAQSKYREASAAYREALALDSTSALAWFNYGNMWMQRNDAPRAHACWMRAVRYDPYMPAARRNLGLLLLQAGRSDEAEEHFTTYFEIEPNEAQKAAFRSELERIRSFIRHNEPSSNEH
jgi:tetratricopeptide (TPR) repeat protein